MGRPTVSSRKVAVRTFYIPEVFEDCWDKIEILSKIDRNEDFTEYCTEFEKIDLVKKNEGLTGLYIRWILTKHVAENLDKIK